MRRSPFPYAAPVSASTGQNLKHIKVVLPTGEQAMRRSNKLTTQSAMEASGLGTGGRRAIEGRL